MKFAFLTFFMTAAISTSLNASASTVAECKTKLAETRQPLLKLLEGGKKDDALLGKVKSTSDVPDNVNIFRLVALRIISATPPFSTTGPSGKSE